MLRAVVALVSCLVLVSCGAEGGSSGSSSESSPSSSESASSGPSSDPSQTAQGTYFTEADSSAINAVARKSQAAAARSIAAPSLRRCNGANGYDAWRKCWHGLLDPYAVDLLAIGAEFDLLAKGAYPEPCVVQLKAAKQAFGGLAGRVKKLLAGFDSSQRSAQTRAVNTYVSTINSIEASYQKPFQDMTKVCYSPEDLAKLSASPAPSP